MQLSRSNDLRLEGCTTCSSTAFSLMNKFAKNLATLSLSKGRLQLACQHALLLNRCSAVISESISTVVPPDKRWHLHMSCNCVFNLIVYVYWYVNKIKKNDRWIDWRTNPFITSLYKQWCGFSMQYSFLFIDDIFFHWIAPLIFKWFHLILQ